MRKSMKKAVVTMLSLSMTASMYSMPMAAGAEEVSEPALSGEVEVQIFNNESEDAVAAWEEIISLFEEATGITVIANTGSQVNSQLDTRWMQGNPPDFIYLNGAGLSADVYEESGLFKDLTSVVEEGYVYGTDKKISDVIDSNSMSYLADGKIYRLPFGRTTHGVWYDAKYFSDNGLEVPTNYTELTAVSEKAVELGTSGMAYAGQYPTYLAGVIHSAVGAYGQEYFDQVFSADPDAMASENMTSILQRWSDYCSTDGFLLTGTTTLDHTTSQIQWLGHETLLLPVGMWLPGEVAEVTPDDFDMQFATSPLVEEGQPSTAVFSAANMAIAENAKNPENAEAFLRFLFTDEVQTIMMQKLAMISVRTDLDYEAATEGISAPVASAMKTAAAAENAVYNRATWKDTGTLFYNVFNELAMGDLTVEDAQAQLVESAQKEASE